jgi:hypothetical protein
MAKSNSSKSSNSKSNSSRRPQPKSPPGGYSGKRTRYDEGGEIDW